MIAAQIKGIIDELPQGVQLVAVSKYHTVADIREAYNAGQRHFGESRVQELTAKQALLPTDIKWNFIGHRQTNKVKYIAPFVTLIHAVDSERLLQEIDRQAQRCGRTIDCLLQLHVAQEETKFGFTPQECLDMLAQGRWKELTHARICGLMGMATNTTDETRIRQDFHTIKQCFNQIQAEYFADSPYFSQISMGMSHDYSIALQEGTTIVRIGSKIFGA